MSWRSRNIYFQLQNKQGQSKNTANTPNSANCCVRGLSTHCAAREPRWQAGSYRHETHLHALTEWWPSSSVFGEWLLTPTFLTEWKETDTASTGIAKEISNNSDAARGVACNKKASDDTSNCACSNRAKHQNDIEVFFKFSYEVGPNGDLRCQLTITFCSRVLRGKPTTVGTVTPYWSYCARMKYANHVDVAQLPCTPIASQGFWRLRVMFRWHTVLYDLLQGYQFNRGRYYSITRSKSILYENDMYYSYGVNNILAHLNRINQPFRGALQYGPKTKVMCRN